MLRWVWQQGHLCFAHAGALQQDKHQGTHLWQVGSQLVPQMLQQIMRCVQHSQPLPCGHALHSSRAHPAQPPPATLLPQMLSPPWLRKQSAKESALLSVLCSQSKLQMTHSLHASAAESSHDMLLVHTLGQQAVTHCTDLQHTCWFSTSVLA